MRRPTLRFSRDHSRAALPSATLTPARAPGDAGALDDLDSLARSEMEVLNKAYALLVRLFLPASHATFLPALSVPQRMDQRSEARNLSSPFLLHNTSPQTTLSRLSPPQEGFGVKMTTKDLVLEDNRLSADDLEADDGDR